MRAKLEAWRQEYNWERPHSSLAYRTPGEFREIAGYANVESNKRFPHLHSHDGGKETMRWSRLFGQSLLFLRWKFLFSV